MTVLRIVGPDSGRVTLDALDGERVIDAIRDHGVVLFRGFSANRNDFMAFTERFGTNFQTYKGGAFLRRKLNRDGSLLSVTGESHGFRVPAHGEMYYNAVRPELLWFFCEAPAVNRGETFVCDGRSIFGRLSNATQALFGDRPIVYERTFAPAMWKAIYQTDDRDEVVAECVRRGITMEVLGDDTIATRYTTPAVLGDVFINNILPLEQQEELGLAMGTVRFDDGSRIPARVLLEIDEAVDAETALISWQQGDLLVVDNLRFLHGRRAYSAPARRRIAVRLSDRSFGS